MTRRDTERRTRLVFRRLLMAVSMLLLFVALITSVGRALLPWAERYQPDLEALISEQLGTPVRFGAMDLRWKGYQPQLILREARVGSGPHLDALSLQLSWRRSLAERRLVADKITLDRPRFTLVRGEGWSIGELPVESGRPISSEPISWAEVEDQLSRLGHLSVRDAEIEFRGPDGRRDRVTFSFAAEMDREAWRASGVARLEGVSDEPLRFSGQGQFGPETDVTLFLSVIDWQLPEVQRWLDRYSGPAVRRSLGGCPVGVDPDMCEVGLPRIDSGRLDGSLWLDWQDGLLDEVTIDADVEDFAVTRERVSGGPVRQARVARVSTDLAWRRETDGWWLNAEHVDLRPAADERLDTHFVRLLARGERVDFATDHADLEHLAVWLSAAPLPPEFLDLLDQNVPRGQAGAVRLAFDGGRLTEGFLRLENFGNTSGVPLRPVVGTAAGEAGMDLTLYRRPAGWLARIDQRDMVLAVPGMFREPLVVDHVRGDLYWFDGQALGLYSPQLELVSNGLGLDGQFHYRPATGQRPSDLGVDASFHLDDSRVAPTYLPRNLIGPNTLKWLDAALEGEGAAGHVPDGHFVFRGDPARAPFIDGGGYFSVVFDFEDQTLPYRPGWPALTEAAGHIAFVNRQFHATIDAGSVASLPMDGSRVSLFDLEAPRVEVAVDREIPLDDLLRGLERTPLLDENALAAITADGGGRFKLDIGIGLTKDAPAPSVIGGYTFDGNRVRVGDERFTFTGLSGRLDFDGTRFAADALRGGFLGKPFTARVAPRDQTGSATRIVADTRQTPAALLGLLQDGGGAIGEVVESRVEGEADFRVRVDVPHRRAPLDIRVDSQLAGWQSRLPAPLAKPREVAWPLGMDLSLDRGRLTAVSGRLEADHAWRLELGFAPDGQMVRSLVTNRADAGRREDGPAHQMRLAFDTLAPAPWAELLAADRSSEGSDFASDLAVDARVDRLRLGGWELRGVTAGWAGSNDGWRLNVAGDQNRGELVMSAQTDASPGLLDGTFDRLHLHRVDGAADESPAPPGAWDLQALPRADLEVASLAVGERALGRLQLVGHPGEGDYRIDRIDWQPHEQLSVTGGGRVIDGVSDAPEGQQTRLSLTAESPDLGAAIESLYGETPIEGGRIEEASLAINWPGAPSSFSLHRAAGNAQFALVEGRLSGIDPGAGRLVGLMSLGALADRLRFDFRDMTQEGLFFERLAGRLRLDRGRMNVDGLELVNPSLSALIDGRMELVDSELDLTARIYADFGMLLPLIGTVAGGPLVGGAILALQETFRQLDEAPEPTVTYHIGGSLGEPVVTTLER
ncbi:MAG: YhdP family protein [Pseudomonadota bacterium]